MKALGLTIDCSRNAFTGMPAFLASGTTRTPRFGPTVPVAPAAARVWQLPQPADPVNTALPAAALVCEAEPLELEPLEPEPDEPDAAAPAAAAPAPGTPACTALGGGVPTGGAPLGFCEPSHFWNAAGVSTRTDARIRE